VLYVAQAAAGGAMLDTPVLTHEQLMAGLELWMTSDPDGAL